MRFLNVHAAWASVGWAPQIRVIRIIQQWLNRFTDAPFSEQFKISGTHYLCWLFCVFRPQKRSTLSFWKAMALVENYKARENCTISPQYSYFRKASVKNIISITKKKSSYRLYFYTFLTRKYSSPSFPKLSRWIMGYSYLFSSELEWNRKPTLLFYCWRKSKKFYYFCYQP